jgi:hypothetical protein
VTLQYQRDIVRNWFERGRNKNETTFDRFLYTWIALNAALSARFPRVQGDRAKVRAFARELAPHWQGWLREDQPLRAAASALEAASPIYEEPSRRRTTIVHSSNADSVILGVYAVRNNLFHGAKQFDALRDHALVRHSATVVEQVFVVSGLYAMATEDGRDLADPITSELAEAAG